MERKKKTLKWICFGLLLCFVLFLPALQISAKSKVKVSKSNINMYCGTVRRIRVRGIKKKSLCRYKSKNARVIKVSAKGYIRAIRPGKAKVTVSYPGKRSAVCKINVMQYVKSLKILSANTVILTEGGSAQINTRVLPVKASSRRVTFVSENKEIVKVDSKGKLYAQKSGTVRIYITTNGITNRKKRITQSITVVVQKATVPEDTYLLTPLLEYPDQSAISNTQMVVKTGLCKDLSGNIYTVYMLNKSYGATVSVRFNNKVWDTKKGVKETFQFLEQTLTFKYTTSDGTARVEKNKDSSFWNVLDLENKNTYSFQGYLKDNFFHSPYAIVLVKGNTVNLVEFN